MCVFVCVFHAAYLAMRVHSVLLTTGGMLTSVGRSKRVKKTENRSHHMVNVRMLEIFRCAVLWLAVNEIVTSSELNLLRGTFVVLYQHQ